VGGVPEIVREGQDGLLVPYQDVPAFQDAVLKGLAADWDREAIVRYAQSLDWDEVVDAVFGELAAATKGSRRHV
jgi:glycosyltransferase involved in cell wall biosynthesis